MLIGLCACCGQHRSEAAKIEEVTAHGMLSGWHECVSEFNLTIVMEQALLHIGGFNIKIDKIKTVKMQSYIPIKLHSSQQILKK
jgi:hypothetical protein